VMGAPRRPHLWHSDMSCDLGQRGMAALLTSILDDCGEPMPKPNYHQARKQKEVARKARQQEKQQRRATRENATAAPTESVGSQEPAGSREAGSENPT
jgi:hypothetical protein